jgi:type IV secretory pathway TraG/TraD family ATPase VirD4
VSRYSDHSTVGGQVMAHRMRMMMQNWNVIWLVGRLSFLGTFFSYLINKWNLAGIWNYLVCLKAVYRNNMMTLPSDLFSHSYFSFGNGRWKEVSDYVIATGEPCLFLKASFEDSLIFALKLSICIGVTAMLLMVLFNKYFGKSLSDSKELISGHEYVKGTKIKKYIKNKSDITLADIQYPLGTECRHTILTGTTGSGKTNVMIELLDQITAKNEKIVVVDTVGTYLNKYYDGSRDIILNPLDDRSVSWSFLNECQDEILLKNTAACLIGSSENSHDKFWEEAAKIVFEETAKKAIEEGKSTDEFLSLLLKVSLKEIQSYLEGTYAHSLMDERVEKMAISIRAMLINAISVFDILKESSDENFSIGKWIASDKSGILFLSCRPVERASLTPLITAWLSIASESLLQLENRGSPTMETLVSKAIRRSLLKFGTAQTSDATSRCWFFIDELHNLKRLPRIETSLAEIRKYGGCFVMGTQMVSQLNKIYGHEVARTITGLCGTKIVMGIPEPDTAKHMSGFLGEKEEVSTSKAISYGANTMRDGVNIAQKTEKKQTVPYTEIMNLAPGEAFIKFSGIDVVTKTKFKLHEHGQIKKIHQNMAASAHLLDLNTFKTKYPEIFGDYLKLSGMNFSKPVFEKPFYIWGNDESIKQTIGQLLTDIRTNGRKVIIFEDGDFLFEHLAEKDDILINPLKKGGLSWDFLHDLRHNKNILEFIKNIKTEYAEIENLTTYLANLDINTKEFFQILCFAPFKQIKSILMPFTNVEDNEDAFIKIRNRIAKDLHCFKILISRRKEASFYEYYESDKSILWASCGNNAHLQALTPFMGKIITLETIKIVSGKSLIQPVSNTIVINHSFGNSRELSDCSKLLLSETNNAPQLIQLFGETITHINSGSCLFKPHNVEDILLLT